MKSKLIRVLCYCFYYFFSRYLPRNSWVGGTLWNALRAIPCRYLFAECGSPLFVDRMVDFGMGDKIHIGNHSGFGENVRLIGEIYIGDYFSTSVNVFVTAYSRETGRTDIPMQIQGKRPDKPVFLGSDSVLFANSIVLPGVKIGRGAIIGAGAVVSRNVPSWAVVVGNPAKVVSFRNTPEQDAYERGIIPIACELPEQPAPAHDVEGA